MVICRHIDNSLEFVQADTILFARKDETILFVPSRRTIAYQIAHPTKPVHHHNSPQTSSGT